MLFCVMATVAWLPPRKITIHLVGDSTMANKETKAFPETGWGMPFGYFFDSTVQVINHAKNGRSTRSFQEEGRWKTVLDNLQPGDYVFIQFGHNDEVKEKVGSYTAPEQYKANLERFVAETRARKGMPVLLTPVSRRQFDSVGAVRQTHPVYSDLVRTVAREQKVALIDMDEATRSLYARFGPEYSKLLFLWVAPGEHPNYPAGKQDNTHFNELGARLVAQQVLAAVKEQHLDLANRIVAPK